jgi:hypothetical protein
MNATRQKNETSIGHDAPSTAEDSGRARELLSAAVKDSNYDYQSLSKAVGKGRTYIHQYVSKGLPRHLPMGVALDIDRMLHLDWRLFVSPRDREIAVTEGAETVAIEPLNPTVTMQFPIIVNRGWVTKYGLAEQSLRGLDVAGDAMAPTLGPDDQVVIDTSQNAPSPPGLFLVSNLIGGGGHMLARCEPVAGTDKVRLSWDNERYTASEVSLDAIAIIGRVVLRLGRV